MLVLMNSCSDFENQSPVAGPVDWSSLQISYGAPGLMLETEWVGLLFPQPGRISSCGGEVIETLLLLAMPRS